MKVFTAALKIKRFPEGKRFVKIPALKKIF
jgi:hypothetical protein